MQQYVQNADRSGSAQSQRPPSRRVIAANAKMPVNRAGVSQQPQPEQKNPAIPTRGQSGNGFHGLPQQGQQLRQPPAPYVNPDPYGTDAESIDTTIARSQNQEPEQVQYDDSTDEDDEEYEEGDDDDDAFQGVQVDGVPDHGQHFQQQRGMPTDQQNEVARRMARGGNGIMFNNDDSYPTTTSGAPDDEQYEAHTSRDDRSHISPTPQLDAQPLYRQHSQPAQHLSNVNANQHAPKKTTVFQQGAAIRNQRPTTGHNEPAAQHHQRTITDPHSTQLPTYSQSNHYYNAPASVYQRPGNQGIPQRGAGARAVPIILPAVERPVQHAAQTEGRIVQQNSHKPLSPEPSEEEVPGGYPIQDYDLPDLFEMEYEDLKNEDFDKNPRTFTPVLPDDMLHHPLQDRLKYVQQHLDSHDQARFFSQLKLTEWEEVGDWFHDRFADIINRTREARKEKRKLAADFEREVEKRHKHVAQKRRRVEEALQQMKHHGQSLVRSPRNSKTSAPGRH